LFIKLFAAKVTKVQPLYFNNSAHAVFWLPPSNNQSHNLTYQHSPQWHCRIYWMFRVWNL